MSKKSAGVRMVRKSAKGISPPTQADLARLRRAAESAVDDSEIPEKKSFQRLKRDENGVLPRQKSPIREAVEKQLARRKLSVYQLWRKARVFRPSLSQAAVYEFLKGQRQLELPSAEALLAAVDLQVVQREPVKTLRVPRANKLLAKKRGR